MPYINTETKQFNISEADIKALFPLVGFPCPFIAPEPFVWYFPAPQPTYDPIAQIVREVDPVLTSKGHWEQQWEVVDLDPEQAAANRAAALKTKREAMVCTPWQIRKAMNEKGIRRDLEAAVAAADQDTKDAYEFAQEFHRLNPLALSIQSVLGKSDEFMDDLFTLAMAS